MDFDHPPSDPLPELKNWLAHAHEHSGMANHNSMTLATVDAAGNPSARIVLLKGLDERGAVFHTNRLSRKGLEISAKPRAALLFHWDALNRQVRIEGDVSQLSDGESDAYFATRPRESRIGAWASRQSQPAKNRHELEATVAAVEKRFEGQDVPRPPHWGGYRVSLNLIEFWQGHPFRMHDRVVYRREADGAWSVQRLFP